MAKKIGNPKGRACDLDKEIGQRIRSMREAAALSQSTLAEAIGITFQQLQKYESGANRISASRLFDLATALGVSVLDFYPSDAETAGELLAVANDRIGQLEKCIGWHAENLKASLKKGALDK